MKSVPIHDRCFLNGLSLSKQATTPSVFSMDAYSKNAQKRQTMEACIVDAVKISKVIIDR